jgi:nucleotide-binding universal stress UspA family protein
MQKILLIVEKNRHDLNALDFACYLAKLTHSKLTGVFLEDIQHKNSRGSEILHGIPYSETIESTNLPPVKEKLQSIEQTVEFFKQAASDRGVNCNILRDRGVPAIEVVKESRFADVIVVSAEVSFERGPSSIPSAFLKKLLSDSECPVIISPLNFEAVKEIYFAYDGSQASVFALKHFTYLLPQFSEKKAIVLQIVEEETNKVVSQNKILEYLKQHYSAVGYEILHGKPADELFVSLLKKNDAMVVMGAFGRSLVSNFFKRSHADLLIKTSNLPIFISHH